MKNTRRNSNKMKNINLYILALVIYSLSACNVKLTDYNPTAESKVVISGFVSDTTGGHKIVIRNTKAVTQSGNTSSISTAIVVVKDNLGLVDTFQYVPNLENQLNSYYKPSKSWAGEKGRTYTLSVQVDGITYTANETMPNLPSFTIDSTIVTYAGQASPSRGKDTVSLTQYNQSGFYSNYIKKDDSLFRVKLYAPNASYGRSNTKMSIYRISNGITVPYNPGSVETFNSSEFQLNGMYVTSIRSSLYFKSGDKVKIVLQAISDKAFAYYDGVNAVGSSDGGIFSAPPGNPQNNISGGALGYFYAALTVKKTVEIKFIPNVTQTDFPTSVGPPGQ